MAKEKISFEDALAKLEEIVAKLENGEATLSESFDLFEEGVKLGNFCGKILDDYEAKVEILLEKNKQDVREPFIQEEN